MTLHALVATFFGVGRAPMAPGTFGSLAALPLGFALHWLGGFPLLLAGLVVVTGVGWWSTAAYLAEVGGIDPPELVVDEVAGQLLALAPMSWAFWSLDPPIWEMPWPAWVSAFLFFRLFDIWKPGPIRRMERRAGAAGVMLDDLVAGLFAGLSAAALGFVFHLVLM